MSDEKQSIIKEHITKYSKRYDQVSWRSADTDFETASSADEQAKKERSPVIAKLAHFCIRRNRKITALVVVVLIFLAIMGGLIYLYYSKQNQSFRSSPVVLIDCGPVTGTIESVKVNNKMFDSYVFKGIPYALPPVKNLRWKAPVALSYNCWKGTFEATKFGNICVQNTSGVIEGSENCLYLNVWSPHLETDALLPVFVWIHGGYLMNGFGHQSGYSPDSEFVTSMNVVAVSMNYRLNAFGFLTLKELWIENESYGNFGLMDQILVLKWVKKNIQNFGGDPNSVTIVGQSSGGTSIFGLLASLPAEGLFQRAITMSASPKFEKSYISAANENRVFIKKSKCKDISVKLKECLYNLTSEEVIRAIPNDVYPYWLMEDLLDFPKKDLFDGALIVMEPMIVSEYPKNIKNINFTTSDKVSVLIGSTAQEIGILPGANFTGAYQWINLKEYLDKRLLNFSLSYSKIFDLYKNINNINDSAQYAYETISSDVRINCPSNKLAKDILLSNKYDVFRYIVTNYPNKPVSLNGFPPSKYAVHFWDSTALFNFKAANSYSLSETDKLFAKTLQENIKHFMIYGHMLRSDWSEGKTGVFNTQGLLETLESDYHSMICNFWNDPKNNFTSYAWIN
ncbi:neurotactin [Hydra vulgaris]|uniref:Carboxylic ester hydrolase n=1 Tax=Hydra vulgaris TaxID=6087 RepID=A0ABM4B717_HYDVU